MNNFPILLVNFGGPRTLDEIPEFLSALLCDKEVIRTPLPKPIHSLLFKAIAKKRSKKITPDYEKIGGFSPIFEDTELIAKEVAKRLNRKVLTFHRYLPKTHEKFFSELKNEDYVVFPFFPQFTTATTGSIATYFHKKMPPQFQKNLHWIRSYPDHPDYISLFQGQIKACLDEKNLEQQECLFLFSAHGIPKKFVDQGDSYPLECERSFQAILKAFKKASSLLCYQSKFGPGLWLKPYTRSVVKSIEDYAKGKNKILFIPLSFTSDHIETLFEIEEDYMAPLKAKGFEVFRCPAFNQSDAWIETIIRIIQTTPSVSNEKLLRH
ncbi:MAG: ferrochelatase [Simkaniaceae bacterium]